MDGDSRLRINARILYVVQCRVSAGVSNTLSKYTHVCTNACMRMSVSVRDRSYIYSYMHVPTYSCTLRHTLRNFGTRLPTRVIATRKRKRNLVPPDDLSLSVDYHRACAYASGSTQERTTRVLLTAHSPWALHNVPSSCLSTPSDRLRP